MVKWFKSLNRTAKTMLLLIVLFAVAIATRWEYVKREVADSFKGRFHVEQPDRTGGAKQKADTTDSLRPAPSGGDSLQSTESVRETH